MFSWISGNGAQPAQSQSEGLRALSRSSLGGIGTVSRDSADTPPSRQLFTQLNVAPVGSHADASDIVQQRADIEEQRANDEERLKTLHKDKSPLEEDGYGLLTMRMVYAWDAGNSALFWTHHGIEYEGSYRQDGVLALVHAIALFKITIVSQVWITVMLYWNSKALMAQWSDGINGLDLNQAADRVSQSVGLGVLEQDILEECKRTWAIKRNEVFIFVLFLWTARMIPEFRMAKNSLRELWSIDAVKDSGQPLLAADGCTVLRLSPWLRILLIASVPLIRAVVAVFIFIAGCDFICSQSGTGDVVLKGMCMWFVTDVDSIFLKAFSSQNAQRKLKSLRLLVKGEANPFSDIMPESWDHGLAGLTYGSIATLVVCYQTGCFGYASEVPLFNHTKAQLYNFRGMCHEYCTHHSTQCG